MSRGVAALTVVVLGLGTVGCGGADAPSQSPADLDIAVDTPELRELKAEVGIDDCRPGPGGGGLPELVLPCLGGGPDVDLAALTGPLLVNVWWSGCAPCRDEMPALQAFYEKHGDVVDVLGVDVERSPQDGIGFAGVVGATYPQVADPGAFLFDQTVVVGRDERPFRQVFPQTLVVDAAGGVARIEAVEFGSVADIEAFVEDALGIAL